MQQKESLSGLTQEEITRKGNPGKPQGEEGVLMLHRMNKSHEPVTNWALDFLTFHDNDRALDIGCGGGATLHRLSERISRGHITGVDYSSVAVDVSKKTNEEEISKGKIDVLPGNVEKLPFADNSFDKIVTVESFYFWPDPEANLKEVYRVLDKSGTFLLVADIYQKDGLSKEILESIQRYHLFNPTPERFRELFSSAGFADIIIHTKEGKDWICVEGKKL